MGKQNIWKCMDELLGCRCFCAEKCVNRESIDSNWSVNAVLKGRSNKKNNLLYRILCCTISVSDVLHHLARIQRMQFYYICNFVSYVTFKWPLRWSKGTQKAKRLDFLYKCLNKHFRPPVLTCGSCAMCRPRRRELRDIRSRHLFPSEHAILSRSCRMSRPSRFAVAGPVLGGEMPVQGI